jgi:hypothetical protein
MVHPNNFVQLKHGLDIVLVALKCTVFVAVDTAEVFQIHRGTKLQEWKPNVDLPRLGVKCVGIALL